MLPPRIPQMNVPQLILFEDGVATHLQPLSLTRPVHDLRVGLLTIREQWQQALGSPATGLAAAGLRELFPTSSQAGAEGCLWINARYLPTPPVAAAVAALDSGHLQYGDELVAVRSDAAETAAWLAAGEPLPCGQRRELAADPARLRHPWDVSRFAAQGIASDAATSGWPPGRGIGCHPAAVVDLPERLFMHGSAVVEPGAILVTEEGPIILAAGARVMAGAMLRGPVAVGQDATVRMGARIYGGTVIGPHSKVGGEVAASVFHSYSNKAHEGYVGNSVFGQWVNLGADTTASNLKMTYGTVKMLDWPTGLEIDTGEQFLGAILGDHCKTGINTMLNTGTIAGVASIIVGAGFPARAIQSFKWVQPGAVTDYRLDKALLDMERMMARRGVPLTPAYRRMMTAIYELGRG
jgi:UDP-N-acetylglucosamine diphosphorylase/glucosamine-1-phosphate N-acetyltransferase